MAEQAQTLNQYTGSDAQGNQTVIVAENMTTACEVYHEQESSDPMIMQLSKTGIRCVLPTQFVTFTTVVKNAQGEDAPAIAGCKATPVNYTLVAGTKQIFTATASEGWTFSKWMMNGVDVEGEEGTKAVALLEIPASPTQVEIRAVFAPTV